MAGVFFSPCPRSRLRTGLATRGSAVPSRVSSLILHTQAESDWLIVLTHGLLSFLPPSTTRAPIHLYRQPPTGQPRVYRIAQSSTDVVYRRESAGTRARKPSRYNSSSNGCRPIFRKPHGPFFFALHLSSHTRYLLVQWTRATL